MVLGGQPPGRVGRRRIKSRAARAALFSCAQPKSRLSWIVLCPLGVVQRPTTPGVWAAEVLFEPIRSHLVGDQVIGGVRLGFRAVQFLHGVAAALHENAICRSQTAVNRASGRAERVEALRVERPQTAYTLEDRRVCDEEPGQALLLERVDRVERLGRRAAAEGDQL